MRTLSQSMGAFAVAALLAMSAGASAAPGDAVKLLVEVPKDTTGIEAGDPGLDVQIVGVDAAGARTGFGDRTLEVSATEGALVAVEAPYKFKYIPPASVDKPTPVTLRAWLKQVPDVKGDAALVVTGGRPYVRLVIVAPSLQQVGTTMDVEVRGVQADGTTVALAGVKVAMTSDGAGTLTQVSDTVFRLTAPAAGDTKSGNTTRLHAHLVQYPRAVGDHGVAFTRDAPPPPAPGGAPGTTPPVAPGATPPAAPGATPPVKPPVATPVKDAPAAEGGVLWPSGNVRILVWRTRNAKEDPWSEKVHELPASGGKLIASSRLSKLRIQIERDDVRKVELNWYIGDKKAAPVHIDDADKDGRLHLEKNKNGKLNAMLECETPEDKPAIYELLLTTSKGEILKEEFVLVRGKDKNDDGEKDKKKK